MKVLIADKFEPAGVSGLEALGCDVSVDPALSPETLPDAVAEKDILVVRSTKVPAAVFDAGNSLKGVIRAGAGYDNIDQAAATAKGVHVCNCPGMNGVAVAELTMAHLLNCDRRVPDQTADLRAGKWRKKEYAKAKGLKGMTLGVVGSGAIGREVIKRARAFDMHVHVWSRSLTVDKAAELGATYGGSDRRELLKMLGACDAVTIHVAANDDTKDMCNGEFFGAMRDGAYFINTSRGSVVDETALTKAVTERGLRCGLDVYQSQPGTPEADFNTPLAGLEGCSFSHHIGASTDQAQNAVAEEVVRIVRLFKETGHFNNCVNEEDLLSARA